jgi:hypothetical protein
MSRNLVGSTYGRFCIKFLQGKVVNIIPRRTIRHAHNPNALKIEKIKTLSTELSLCRSPFILLLKKLNAKPSIGASHQISAHFGKAVSEKKIFRKRPI